MLYLSPIPKYSDPLPLWTKAAESQNVIPSFEYVVARTLRGFVLGPLSITGRFAASQQPLAATWNFICRCEDASRLVPTTAKRARGKQSPLRWATPNNRTLRGFATCARNDMFAMGLPGHPGKPSWLTNLKRRRLAIQRMLYSNALQADNTG
jgi:hypothetical protein